MYSIPDPTLSSSVMASCDVRSNVWQALWAGLLAGMDGGTAAAAAAALAHGYAEDDVLRAGAYTHPLLSST